MGEFLPSILIYIVVFLASAASIYYGIAQYKKKKKLTGIILVALGILLPSVMAGIRYNVGVDYPTYVSMFENVILGRQMYFRSIEPASTLIITVSAHLRSGILMFFTFSFITSLCYFAAFTRLFKHDERKVALAYLLYLCIIFPTTLNAVRSGTAIAIAMLALSYFVQKWSLKTIAMSAALTVLAFLFHRSVIILLLFLPVFWLVQRKNQKGTLAKKTAVLFIIYLLPAIMLPLIYSVTKDFIRLGDYGRYIEGVGDSFSMPLANIMMTIPIVYSLLYYYKNEEQFDQESAKLVYCALFYIPLSIFTGWLTFTEGLSRISFIFDPIIVCLMATLFVSCLKAPKIWRAITISCIILVVGTMFIRNLNWSKALPYRTIFQQGVSYAP